MKSALLVFASLVCSVNGRLGLDAILPITTPMFECLKNSSYEFYVARVFRSNGLIDNTGIANIINARLAGLDADAYLFPCFSASCGNGTDQVTKSVNAIRSAGAQIDTLWLDIERFAWSNDTASNRAFIKDMIVAADELGVAAGIYTYPPFWAQIVGDWIGGSHLPLWWLYWDHLENMDAFVPFGGWTAPTIKQISGDVAGTCGVSNIDKNYML
ncbi:hypothetical protein PENTCL1PPCAC_3761 [Pristionchus entomophagus]|uniref:Lysozyme n=1 Tax=Pristionchus entomophagus TaxID=358040 RepID=A0AAV5SE14_9BILA|nr:hypothetical protein PENTCL1PPCAC_3761 [Pristionchus entomophagus]